MRATTTMARRWPPSTLLLGWTGAWPSPANPNRMPSPIESWAVCRDHYYPRVQQHHQHAVGGLFINLSDAVVPGSVQAGDFTVNGTPANSFVLGAGNTQITFHFNGSPIATQGVQTMHIPAGAFTRARTAGVFDLPARSATTCCS